MKKLSVFIFVLVLISASNFAQVELEKELSNRYNPAEIVSISPNVSFDQAISMLSRVSEFFREKSIISEVSIPRPIGKEIAGMPYMKALNTLVNLFNLTYEETESTIIVKQKMTLQSTKIDEDIFAELTAKEVNISAVFFEADHEKSVQRGIDWKFLLSGKGKSANVDFRTESVFDEAQKAAQGNPPGFDVNLFGNFDDGSVTSILRFFENQQIGEIIASPSIAVRNKQKGRIQIGSDFSIKQRDFSGNIIEKFYSAGSIIEVTPYIYEKAGIEYVLLKLKVERSSFFPSELTTEIKKTAATSDILLLDGEETVIGGLYITEEQVERNGIPILKDLPWWVFGIRYLTGADKTIERRKEVVIIIKAEILPSLEERFKKESEIDNLIKERIKKNERQIKQFKVNYFEDEK